LPPPFYKHCIASKLEQQLEIIIEPKNFGLSPEQFSALLERLEAGDEALVEVVFKSHFEICRSFLVKNFGIKIEKKIAEAVHLGDCHYQAQSSRCLAFPSTVIVLVASDLEE
jgi:hypothetical protein